MRQKIAILLLALCATATVSAQTSYTDDQGVEFSIGSDYATITGYTGTATDLTIPATVQDVPATHVGANAFAGKTTLATVTMEATGEINFAANAFDGCSALTAVNLTSGQTKTVGQYAFRGCAVLKKIGATADVISLPLVADLSNYAFYGALALTTVELPLATRIGDYAFYNTTASPNGITTVTGGENLTYVGNRAFYGCNNLKTIGNTEGLVYLPKVNNVGYYTFLNCRSIEAVKMNQSTNNYTNFYDYCFYGCSSLTKVNTRYTRYVNQYAFQNCSKLVGIDNNDNPTRIYLQYTSAIAANAFRGCSSITTVYTANSLTSIGENAFNGCAKLTSFILNTLTPPTLGTDAFTGISTNATFSLYPQNSYKSASSYANNDSWKVLFDGTSGNYSLIAYVNKSKQYGTVSCDVPLYFYSATTAANLYKVKATSQSLAALKEVSSRKLPANTGAVLDVMVGGTVKTSTAVQVLFDESASAADFAGNLLVANVSDNTEFKGQENGKYNLILVDGEFVKANDGTLAGGLAYLPVALDNANAKLALTFGDEVTGIENVENEPLNAADDAWYTPQGVRVAQPTKGVYIHNGKKVMVK